MVCRLQPKFTCSWQVTIQLSSRAEFKWIGTPFHFAFSTFKLNMFKKKITKVFWRAISRIAVAHADQITQHTWLMLGCHHSPLQSHLPTFLCIVICSDITGRVSWQRVLGYHYWTESTVILMGIRSVKITLLNNFILMCRIVYISVTDYCILVAL